MTRYIEPPASVRDLAALLSVPPGELLAALLTAGVTGVTVNSFLTTEQLRVICRALDQQVATAEIPSAHAALVEALRAVLPSS